MSESTHRQRAAETKRRRTRAALLEAGEAAFGERGWSSTKMSEIAQRANVSSATVYLYYKTKGALIADIYHPLVVELEEKLASDLAASTALSALRNLVKNLCVLARSKSNLTIAMLTAVREETVADDGSVDADMIRRKVRVSDVMARCLHEAQQSDEVPSELPVIDIASYHTNALLLRLFAVADESPEDMAKLVLSQLLPVLNAAPPQQDYLDFSATEDAPQLGLHEAACG